MTMPRTILACQSNIQQKISQVATEGQGSGLLTLQNCLQKYVSNIEDYCQQNQLEVSLFGIRNRKAYAWMKFLLGKPEDATILEQHVDTVRRLSLQGKSCLASSKRKANYTQLSIELTNFSYLYQVKPVNITGKRGEKGCRVQLCEGFLGAEDNVLRAVMETALYGKKASTATILRDYTYSEAYAEILFDLDSIVELAQESSLGQHHDLEHLFMKVNEAYFDDCLPKPRLTWSSVASRRILGRYQPSRDRVLINKILDHQSVPSFVLEFVMYHELLHKMIGVERVKSRYMAHTSYFRQQERAFKRYHEATKWIEEWGRRQ